MSSLADILGEGFDKHAVALAAKPLRARAPGIIGAIRRRRAARAAAASGVSVLAIGAIAFGAVHWWPPAIVQPADAPAWCDLNTYPQVNPEALGAFGYAGRIWANEEDNEYVYVAPDGSHATLEPDSSDGSYSVEYEGLTLPVPGPPYPALPWTRMVHDFATDGSSSAAPYAVGPDEMPYYGTVTPVLMYEWTTVAPSEVPQGVDEFGIAALQLSSLGFDVSLGERGYAPAGASLEQVVRWTDGRERVVPVPDGEEWLAPLVGGADFDGLASVALRVAGLPDGQTYEVVSTYDASKSWAVACAPEALPTPSPRAFAWCDLDTYPQVNPDALGLTPYLGRVYADYVDHTFVYVAPDGSRQTLEPDADGMVTLPSPVEWATLGGPTDPLFTGPPFWEHYAMDFFPGGSAGGGPVDGVSDPNLLYEWTTIVPDEIPKGVNAAELSQILVGSLGFAGTGLQPSAVPADTVVETVFRWTDGRERSVRVLPGGFGGYLEDYSGLASVSVRVSNLPDVGTFEITSTYDASKTWAAACAADVSMPTLAPTPTATAAVATPYLEGPESALFQCLAPLPAGAEDAIATEIVVKSGVTFLPDAGMATDFGPRGIVVTSSEEVYEADSDLDGPSSPGWNWDWGSSGPDGPLRGAYVFAALAWVDGDDVIIGREVSAPDPDGLHDIGGMEGLIGGASSGQHEFSYVVGYVDSLGVACDGVEPSTLASANLIWIEGYGPDADHMTWSWTRVGPLSAS